MTPQPPRGRKGLSPLIATILLIAFAVALGVLIMSWTVETSTGNRCEDTSVQLYPDQSAICYDPQAQRLELVMRNTGDEPVAELLLTAIDRERNLIEERLPADLEPGTSGRYEIPFNTLTPTDVTASIAAVIADGGGSQRCVQDHLENIKVGLC